MKRLAWVNPEHLEIRESRDPRKGEALYWIGPDWDGNIRPLAIPYGGVEMTASSLRSLQKNGPAVHAGLASYIALGCDDEVDEDNQPVEMKIWNGHPANWGKLRGPPEGNNWWGARVNQGAFPMPASERISEVRLVDVCGTLYRPDFPNHDPNCMVAWVLEGQVRFQDELEGCYNLTATTRTMVSLGYRAPKPAPTTPTLSTRREASRQATLMEREAKIAEEAEERRQARLQAQALLASKAKVMEKQRVDGMCEKARLGKKRKHDRDEWEEGDNI
ncbi:hypothetical protein B484DRAFT_454416 [Ochromonadaceae sp. CCMP2298]|nr:hypothetical protein B484DRAFT_454416 [Ochromonadaceae sp. CCMP2298]